MQENRTRDDGPATIAESTIRDWLADHLRSAGFDVAVEEVIPACGRADLIVTGGGTVTAVEVKKTSRKPDLQMALGQALTYLSSPRIDEALVVVPDPGGRSYGAPGGVSDAFMRSRVYLMGVDIENDLYAMFPWLWPQGAYMYPWGSRAALRHYGITV